MLEVKQVRSRDDRINININTGDGKKWFHCFEDVCAILFVVATDCYEPCLLEGTNRIHEQRKLFDDVVNSKWFQTVKISLFLNKIDLFRDNVKKGSHLKVCFPDYKGERDADVAVEFMKHKFKKLNRRTGREMNTHCVCDHDTESVRYVLNSFQEEISAKMLYSGPYFF